MLLFAAGGLSLNGFYLKGLYGRVAPWGILTGRETREAFLERHWPETTVLRHINRNLSPDVRILFTFMGGRGYYSDRDYLLAETGEGNTLQDLAVGSLDGQELKQRLGKMGITHLLVNEGVLGKWLQRNLPERERGIVVRFMRECTRREYASAGYALYRLEPVCADAEPTHVS